ncbi:hypothetical protein CVT25_004648 [Psilocybe cyanescens]|uniref:C2 NT-type domain-containing protein n=1 Tax=Psilocybe cyanescens TaxID=93625 RepID=A0A409XMH9_PSICY|nr:hypothetical protein CVT25_004648 [Psilocybe cyanescens]
MAPAFNHPSGSTGPRNLFISLDDTLKSPTPRPGHGMYLTRPLNGNGSTLSVNDPHRPHTPHTPHTPIPGLRQLGHLLPRHTYFRARVTIHQISSVPFVSGEFGVRWKFKGVQTPAGNKSGLLDRVKARAEKRTASDKGKAREDSGEMSIDNSPHILPSSLPVSEDGHTGGGRQKSIGGGGPASRPPLANRSGTASSVSSHSSHADNLHQHLSPDWGLTTSSSSTNASSVTIAPSPSTTNSDLPLNLPAAVVAPTGFTPARGMTPFLKLKDHSVVWSQTLDTVLKFDVDRESSLIQPSPLKLVVMQRVIPDDPRGSPQNPRLGAVYLNLAEYIGQGSVERRYLLKESKTNATLKLTIEMTYVSGETNYTPPPLAKGEILNGIAGFLQSDIVKKRPRALDIYGPYHDQEELDIDLLGVKSTATAVPRTARTVRKASNKSSPAQSESEDDEEVEEEDPVLEEVGVAFDVQRLPFAYSTKTTELLIDALFNPVKISDKRGESPFTVFEPPPPGAARAREAGLQSRSRSRQRSERGLGLGLSGVAVDRDRAYINGDDGLGAQTHCPSSKRQGSISSSVYTTTTTASSVCSSVSSKAATAESTKDHGRSSQLESSPGKQAANQNAGAQTRTTSTPEGRVVVGRAQEEQIGGVRAWWRKRTRHSSPTRKITV